MIKDRQGNTVTGADSEAVELFDDAMNDSLVGLMRHCCIPDLFR